MRHTYSAGGIVVNTNGQLLLIKEGDDFWGLPKGRREADEGLLEIAVREIGEEAGLHQLTLIDELGTYTRHPDDCGREDVSELKHITLFLFTTDTAARRLGNAENNTVSWVETAQALNQLTHPKDRKFLEHNLGSIDALLKKHASSIV